MFRPQDCAALSPEQAASCHAQAAHDYGHLAHDGAPEEMLRSLIQEAGPGTDPSNFMLFGLLMRTRALLMQATERGLGPAGLSWAKVRFLLHLAKQEHLGRDGALPSELSEMQDIKRNTVSALINGLEADGLITRGPHSGDRRKLVIRLTPEGREALHVNLARHVRLVNCCFDALDPEERNTLLALLSRLEEKLKEKVWMGDSHPGGSSTAQSDREEQPRR